MQCWLSLDVYEPLSFKHGIFIVPLICLQLYPGIFLGYSIVSLHSLRAFFFFWGGGGGKRGDKQSTKQFQLRGEKMLSCSFAPCASALTVLVPLSICFSCWFVRTWGCEVVSFQREPAC